MVLQRLRFALEEKCPPSMQKNAGLELPFARKPFNNASLHAKLFLQLACKSVLS